MPGWLLDDDAATARGQQFMDFVTQHQRETEEQAARAAAVVRQTAAAAAAPPRLAQPVTNAGQQFMDFVTQRRQEMAPPPQPAAPAGVPNAGQQFMDYVTQRQQAFAQPDQAAPTSPTPALPHAEEPATQTDDLGSGWKTQFDWGSTYTGDYRTGTKHRGIDLTPSNGGGIGTTVKAFQPGTVTNISRDSGAGGLMVYVQDDQGLTHAYMHLAGTDPNLKVGQHVDRGTPIAQMGESGTEGSPHLHYEVRQNAATGDPQDKLIDPRPYMAGGGSQRTANAGAATRPTSAQGAMPEVKLDTSSPEAFIRSIAPAAQYVSSQTGIPAAAMIGMAANETGYGRYADGNNLFGIKGQGPAGSINAGTWEDYGNGPVQIRDAFRAYDNLTQSFQDFADLVTNAPRYAAAKGQQTVEGFVGALKAGGYMTDPNYVGKIKSIVDRYAPQIDEGVRNVGGAFDALGTQARAGVNEGVQKAQALAQEADRLRAQSEQILRDMDTSRQKRLETDQQAATQRRQDLQQQFDDTLGRVHQTGQRVLDDINKPRDFSNPFDQFQAGFHSPAMGQPTPSDRLTNPLAPPPEASRPYQAGSGLGGDLSRLGGMAQGMATEAGRQSLNILAGMTPEEAAENPREAILRMHSAAAPRQLGLPDFAGLYETGREVVDEVTRGRIDQAAMRLAGAPAALGGLTSAGQASQVDIGGIGAAGLKGGGATSKVRIPTGIPLVGGTDIDVADLVGLAINFAVPQPEMNGLKSLARESFAGSGDLFRPATGFVARQISAGLQDWGRTPLAQAFRSAPQTFQRGLQDWANAPIGEIARDLVRGPVARFLMDESGQLDVDRLVEVAAGFKQRAQDIVRMYHGGAGDFVRTDLSRDAGRNLYGPGLYTTSDPRVAGGIVAPQGPLRPPEIQQQIDRMIESGQMRAARDLRNKYPHEPGGEVLAEGYAQHRSPEAFEDAQAAERTRRMIEGELARVQRDMPEWVSEADKQAKIQSLESQLADMDAEIETASKAIPAGPNVRAVDVPRDLNLFDMEAPVDPAQLDAIGQAVGDVLGDPLEARSFTTNVRTQIPARDLNGDRVWKALVEHVRSAPGFNSDTSPQAKANQVLEAMGYEGIKHEGGKRVPMYDPNTGLPIEHDVRILFQQGLDKARNAYSGGPAAFTSPVAGALGAEAATDEEDPNRGLKVGTASLVGLMASPRGARQAALTAAELAGKMAPISPSPEIIQAARDTLSMAARAVPTNQPERVLAPAVQAYGREAVDTVLNALTPNRIASLQQRVGQVLSPRLVGKTLDERAAGDLVQRIWHSGLDQLQDTLTIITGAGDQAALALARGGQFTGKFTQGDFQAATDISERVVNNAVKAGDAPRMSRVGAADFTLREGLGADRAFTGGTQMPDPISGLRDPGALMRSYAYVGSGEPLVSTSQATLYAVWKPRTPMVVTFHHHFGPLAPDYPAHAASTGPGIKDIMWRGEQSLVGATTTDVGSPLGARKVGWEAAGIDVGDGRKIASTDLAVGSQGAADMRMATLLASMPQQIVNAIRGGRLTDPEVIAALLLRGEAPRVQPARLAAIDAMNPARGVGKPANKLSDAEARSLNQAAIKQSSRTEALVLDPRVEDLQAIYINQPPGRLGKQVGLVRDNPDAWSLQRVAEEIAARAKAAGNDIPIRYLDPTPEIAGKQIVRVQPKMISEAQTIGGAADAPPLAPGRQRIVDNYLRAPGAQYLGGVAGAIGGGAETDENDPDRGAKVSAAAVIGAVAPGAMRGNLSRLLARNVPRVAGGLAGAAASEFSMTDKEKEDTVGRVNRDILGALAGSVAPGAARGAFGLAKGQGPDLATLRAAFDFAAPQVGPPRPGTSTNRTFAGEAIATSKDFMLSALGTHVMNIASQLTEMVKQPLVAAVSGREQDALLGLISAGGSIPDAWAAMRQAVKTGRTSQSRPGTPSTLAAHPFLRLLGGADDFFRVIAGNMGATMEAQRLIREAGAVTQPQMDAVIQHNSQEIFEAGKKAGATTVFSSEGGQGLGQIISDKKQDLLNSGNKGLQALGVMVDALVPFSGVPDAIWRLGLQRTPVLGEAIHGWKLARGLAAGDGRTASHEAGELLVQSAISMTIISNVAAGNITGPDNPERPSSIKLGGQWYDYQGWGPFQIPLAIPAAIYESAGGVSARQGKSGIDWSDNRVRETALSASMRVMMDASYISSMVDLAHAIGTEGLGPGALSKTAVGYASRFSPAMLASIAQGLDPVERDVTRELPGALAEKFQSRTPILSQQLPAKVDPYTGAPEERLRQGFAGSLLKANTRQPSPLESEINRLRLAGYSDVPHWEQYPKTVSRNGVEVKLTETEQRQVAAARGLLAKDYAAFLKDKDYQSMTDQQKARFWAQRLERASDRNFAAWSSTQTDASRQARLDESRRVVGRLEPGGPLMAAIDELIQSRFPGSTLLGEPERLRDDLGAPVPGNRYTVSIRNKDGSTQTVTLSGTPGRGPVTEGPTDFNVVDAGKPDGKPAAGDTPEETNARIAQAQQATAASAAAEAEARARLKGLVDLDDNRAKNLATRSLYMTDEEIATMDKQLADQGLTREQINAQLKIAADNNRQTAVGNQIAAQNAATAATRAVNDAKIDERRVGLEENKAATDEDIRRETLAFEKDQAALNQKLASDKLTLDQLTQRQTNETNQARVGVEQGNLTVSQGSAVETARSNKAREDQAKADAAQRAAEAKQTAEATERGQITTAASSVYGAERTAQSQAGTTGASLINQRLSSAQGMLNNILGMAAQGQSSSGRFGPLGGGLHAMPAGFDAGAMLQGIQGYTAELGGGQATYDAAANMVKHAGGDVTSPQGQAAYGVLAQMLEKYKGLTGVDHPAAAAAGAAAQTGPAAGVASPTTQAAPAALGGAAAPALTQPATVQAGTQSQAFQSPIVSRGTEGVGNPWAGGNTPPVGTTWQNPAFQSPVAPPKPTIVINA